MNRCRACNAGIKCSVHPRTESPADTEAEAAWAQLTPAERDFICTTIDSDPGCHHEMAASLVSKGIVTAGRRRGAMRQCERTPLGHRVAGYGEHRP